MALIRLKPESEIQGKAKAVVEAVKARWDEPELSHIIRAHAALPDLLVAHAAAWRSTMDPGVWDRPTKEMIATVVSGVNVCEYWITFHHAAGRRYGYPDDEQWAECAYAVEAVQQVNTFADGFRIPCDGAPWAAAGPEPPVIAPPADGELTDRVRATFDDILEFLGVKEVPNVFRAMAREPRYLTGTWRFYRACFEPGRLTRLVKEAVAFAVSVTTRSRYGIDFATRRLRAAGVTDAGLMELMQVIDRFNGINKFADVLLVEPDSWNLPERHEQWGMRDE